MAMASDNSIGLKQNVNLLLRPHNLIAKNLELAYLSAGSNRNTSGEVFTLAHDARTDQLRSQEMIQILGVTADHILKRMIPYLKKGIEKKNAKLILTALNATLKRIQEMEEAAKDIKSRYEQFQKQINTLKQRLESAKDASEDLDSKIEEKKESLGQAEANKKESESKKQAILQQLTKMHEDNVRELEYIEVAGKERIHSSKYPGWCDLLCGIGIGVGAVMMGPAVLVIGSGFALVKGITNTLTTNTLIDSHTKRMIDFQTQTDTLEEKKRSVLENADDQLRKNKTEITIIKTEIKAMEDEKARSEAGRNVVAAVGHIQKLDGYFTTMMEFWSNMNSAYKAIKVNFEDNPAAVDLNMDKDTEEMVMNSLDDAAKQWLFLRDFCNMYQQKCQHVVAEDYRFLSENLGSMTDRAIEDRKNELRLNINQNEQNVLA